MVGYGEQEFAEDYPGVSYYGEPDYSGYTARRLPASIRDVPCQLT